MIGSNALDLKRCADELDQLGLSDQTKERVLRLKAVEFLDGKPRH
jgi:hypothetical protein